MHSSLSAEAEAKLQGALEEGGALKAAWGSARSRGSVQGPGPRASNLDRGF
jgi:hypothetical protein